MRIANLLALMLASYLAVKLRPSKSVVISAATVAFLIPVLISPVAGSHTIPEAYQERIFIACFRGRIPDPSGDCSSITWLDVARYHVARVKHRIRSVATGPPCGGEASVYFSLIENRFWGLDSPPDLHPGYEVLLWDSTRSTIVVDTWHSMHVDPMEYLPAALWDLRRETIDDYLYRNDAPTALDGFHLPLPAVVMSHTFVDSFTTVARRGGDPYRWLYKTHPGAAGLYRLSRPGFSADGMQALIELGWMREYLYGQGQLLVLSCRGGEWVLRDTLMTWIS